MDNTFDGISVFDSKHEGTPIDRFHPFMYKLIVPLETDSLKLALSDPDY